jgi:hypothetical protein
MVQITRGRADVPVAASFGNSRVAPEAGSPLSGPSAIFRLSSGQGQWLTVSLGLPTDSTPAADIVFRYLQRLSLTLAERLELPEDDGMIQHGGVHGRNPGP